MNVIITGTTGMVGKGVLLECLESSAITAVTVINRKPLDLTHPKLTEILHKDFLDFAPIENQLTDYDACFHCMGVSSVGMKEEQYNTLTYSITKSFVDTLHTKNPSMVFNYVSGTGTDSTEQGGKMWARVKGKTENLILNAGFKDAYMFRAGAIVPEKGIKSSTGWYNILYVVFRPLFPLMRKINSITTSSRLGKAMINSITANQELKLLENKDINDLGV